MTKNYQLGVCFRKVHATTFHERVLKFDPMIL